MEAVILHPENSVEARNLEAQENSRGKREFDNSIEGLHLLQIYSISVTTGKVKTQICWRGGFSKIVNGKFHKVFVRNRVHYNV